MIDPLSIGLGLGGLLLQQFNAKKATDAAKQNQAFIQQGLSRADQTSAEQLGSARQQAGDLSRYAQQNYSDLLAQAMSALSGQNTQARYGADQNLAEARRGAGESLTEARRGAQELRDVGQEGGDRIAAAARTSSNIQGRNRPLFDDLLQRAADDYRYSQPRSEDSRRDEITRLLNMATPQPLARVDQRGLATITQGAPVTTPQERLAQIMLKAREQAGKEFTADQASGSQRRLGAIAQFGQQAQGVGDTEKDYLNALIGNRETALKTAGAGNQSILTALQGGNQSILAALAGGNQSILDALIKGNQGVSGAIQSGGQSVLGAMGVGNKAIQDAIANQYLFSSDAMKNVNTAAGNVTQASALQKPDLAGTAALMRALGGTAAQNKAGSGGLLGSLFGGEGTTGDTIGATVSGGTGRGRGSTGFGDFRDAQTSESLGINPWPASGAIFDTGPANYPWPDDLSTLPGYGQELSTSLVEPSRGFPTTFDPSTALRNSTTFNPDASTFSPTTAYVPRELDIYNPDKPILDFFGGRRPTNTRAFAF